MSRNVTLWSAIQAWADAAMKSSMAGSADIVAASAAKDAADEVDRIVDELIGSAYQAGHDEAQGRRP